MKKILIVCPDLKRVGGVANHYLGLNDYWSHTIEYIYYGRRNSLKIHPFFLFPYDLLLFSFRILFGKYDLIIVNPSLRKYQLFRDGLYLLTAKIFRKKVVTFIHGWDEKYIEKLIRKPFFFQTVYGHSEIIYVLCTEFRQKLMDCGLKVPVLLTTTKVDDKLLKNFSIDPSPKCTGKLLFLARIEKNKGIYFTIEVFKRFKQMYPEACMYVVGSGKELRAVETLTRSMNGIKLLGAKFGEELANCYKDSDIYLLPTTHGEGMPTSVLEAMAFGLPVITRPVGGLKDFFEDGKMGYLIEDFDTNEYIEKIVQLMRNEKLYESISSYNYNYAQHRFLASKVARQLEMDFEKYIF